MRIFISSTPEELEVYQTIAGDVAAELGLEVALRKPALGRGLTPVAACARQVAASDVVLVLVGHRRGRVPPPEAGGDGRHPWTWWETRAAFSTVNGSCPSWPTRAGVRTSRRRGSRRFRAT